MIEPKGSKNFDPLKYNTRNSELTQEGVNLQRELVEAAREYARYQQLLASEEAFKQVREDKSLLEELRIKLNALSIEEKRRLLQGLVDGDIVISPDFLDFFESDNFDEHVMNIMKVRSQIPWKYNPAIIQEVLGVIIPNVDETTWDGSGRAWIIKHTRFVHGVFHDLDYAGPFLHEIHAEIPPASPFVRVSGRSAHPLFLDGRF